MTKRKDAARAAEASVPANGSAPSTSSTRSQGPEPSTTPSLTISRNKHWRFISAFHGPWLQLPHEILETLAHSNYLSPRPRQADPGVLFDLLKVRKLVDEAADLTVRAQNGTASSALNNDNGLPGAALGLGIRGGPHAKLSPERKHRMRELATQKLSQAYRLDEVAASVATMQSASTLDSVANLVLQRAPANVDAKYVQFFHEKIPSRMMAEYTSLAPLDDIIAYEPGHAAPLRTRALTKIFKEDFKGAVDDLTAALALSRSEQGKHLGDKSQLVSMKQAREDAERRRVWSKDWMHEHRVAEDDQPRGLELQLLFQRGNQYLTIACQNIKPALENFSKLRKMRIDADSSIDIFQNPQKALDCMTSAEQDLFRRGLDAREVVRKYAKRALKDYTSFFSQLDYAYAASQSHEVPSGIFDRDGLVESIADQNHVRNAAAGHSQALTHRGDTHIGQNGRFDTSTDQQHGPSFEVHTMSELLSAAPPVGLPHITTSTGGTEVALPGDPLLHAHKSEFLETLTYHPLLPETLHSLLLSHTLLQTPPTTVNRIATNVARLARLADGYPFFLSARSPARADWSEILRKTKNWPGLAESWDQLCKAANPEGQIPTQKPTGAACLSKKTNGSGVSTESTELQETEHECKERIHKEAVLDALGDERVVDDETFQKSVAAREKRAWLDLDHTHDAAGPITSSGEKTPTSDASASIGEGETGDWTLMKDIIRTRDNGEPYGRNVSGKATVAKDEEYLIGTERAEAISRWVLEAPASVGHLDGTRPRRKKRPAKKRAESNMENSVESLSILDLE